jgi:hypothetical protein
MFSPVFSLVVLLEGAGIAYSYKKGVLRFSYMDWDNSTRSVVYNVPAHYVHIA